MCTDYVASTVVWEEFPTNTMNLKGTKGILSEEGWKAKTGIDCN